LNSAPEGEPIVPKVSTAHLAVDELHTQLLVLHVFERDRDTVGFVGKVDTLYGGAIGRVLRSGDFAGRPNDTLVVYPPDGDCSIRRVLLVGVGKREDHTVERLRRAVGSAVRVAERMSISEITISVGHVHHLSEHMGDFYAGVAAIEAAILASWEFRELKTQPDDAAPRARLEAVTLLAYGEDEQRELDRAAWYAGITARAANLARDLQTRPATLRHPRSSPTTPANWASDWDSRYRCWTAKGFAPRVCMRCWQWHRARTKNLASSRWSTAVALREQRRWFSSARVSRSIPAASPSSPRSGWRT
jgi:leucyl aminopeptidase